MEEVLRLHDSRNHKVTGSLGVYDAYKYIRKNKWFDIGRPLKEGEFYKIIRGVNNLLAAELIKGNQINLPHRLGTLEIRKRPTRVAIVEGKLVTNLPIDWDATLQLWYEDKEAYEDRFLVRINVPEIYKIFYNKNLANYNNKSFYQFTPNRELKLGLKHSIKENPEFDAFKQ